MDGKAWWATVHGVAKSWTRLSNFTFQGFRSSGNNGSFFPSHRKTVSNQKSYARTEEKKKNLLHNAKFQVSQDDLIYSTRVRHII